MRALLAHLTACWAESRSRRLIIMLEREQAYHRALLSFHAERANWAHHALVRARRELHLICLRAHVPSGAQLDGSRR